MYFAHSRQPLPSRSLSSHTLYYSQLFMYFTPQKWVLAGWLCMLVLLAGDVPVTVVVAVPLHSLLYMVMCLFHFLYDVLSATGPVSRPGLHCSVSLQHHRVCSPIQPCELQLVSQKLHLHHPLIDDQARIGVTPTLTGAQDRSH